MDNANVALVKSLYAAFGRGDIATIIGALAPEVDWEGVGRPSDFPAFGRRKGQAAVQEFFGIVGGTFSFTEFSPKEFYTVDDKVFVLGHYAMTVKANGRTSASDWIHVFTIRSGKVATFREFSDTATLVEAVRGR